MQSYDKKIREDKNIKWKTKNTFQDKKNVSTEQIKIWAIHIVINFKKRPKQSYHIYKARALIKYTRAWGRYCKTVRNER